ncbi:hypothetical protein TVAG_202160 [Trichomonas vaginalis G3]|uniref:Flagellar associated protein n=1 Tax=Trichomonas vaginalis (strain ATCC PRA-98 / G3) TaxID=412133 RepID=A2DWN7_TRIV3|nr:protein of unknown function (DUF4483) [Trichomonas vaginalis G3]EAY15222.1 hypothetical protein TVAG_202160 [Trichomonas vaginalis G3]KAI5550624.1 protein of unknown function (DUF4483) [Trichomonas vaginalis G3]|eukprot:XP_001327445.1 hypothetical protein [Trichomonas vaginalis G3]
MDIYAYRDYRPSMAKNALLVHGDIARATPSTHNLPPENYVYGIKSKKEAGVKEMFDNWAALENQPQSARRDKEFKPKQDYIATNRSAVKHGCITSREFREYQIEHPIMQKQKVFAPNSETPEAFHNRVSQMVHGKATPTFSEMDDCMHFKTGRALEQKAWEKKRAEQERRSLDQSKGTIAQRSHRPTKASIGHQYVAKEPNPVDSFKMKRFLAINRCSVVDHW